MAEIITKRDGELSADIEKDPTTKQRRAPRNFHRVFSNIWTMVRETVQPKKEAQETSANNTDFDDMDNPVYRRPKGLDHLTTVTHFSRPELKRLYRAFKAEAPTGLITEETFRNMYSQFFPKGAANGSQYPRYVFNSLVQDQSGALGFEDIVLVLSDLCRGSADKKLRWAFHIYDIDGDGVISRSELEDVALSINELTGETGTPTADPVVHSSAVRLWVDRIFQKMDLNDDGVISQEEFLSVCLQDEDISRSLAIFNDVF